MSVRSPLSDLSPEQIQEKLSLWKPQREAVAKMQQYIRDFHQGGVEGAALVHMPTGSGKTGVIAVLGRCTLHVGCTLVLTPRLALRKQLYESISGGFFKKLNPQPDLSCLPKHVKVIDNREQILKIKNIDESVLIMTVQLLYNLCKEKVHCTARQILQDNVSLVIIDEGHCEPAVSWSKAIRDFITPKIIFSATPFRNDLKVFDINPNYVYSYTFHNAVKDHVLRDVEFIPMEKVSGPSEFVQSLLDFYRKKFPFGEIEKRPRVIIRCDSHAEIRQIAAALKHQGCKIIAIHEVFSDQDESEDENKSVPIPGLDDERCQKFEDVIFWIHQYKLQEGIDDERFQILAPYQPLKSGRALVQQVGRIIRNPRHDPQEKGLVLDYSEGLQKDIWRNFLEYDKALTDYGVKTFNLATGTDWLAELFKNQPVLTYMKHRFRSALDLNKIDPHKDLRLPHMVNLRLTETGFSLKKLCEQLETKFEDDDRIFQRYDIGSTIIYLYITFDNSPLLERTFFIEPKLGVTYLHTLSSKSGPGGSRIKLLAYYDSSGYLPLDYQEVKLGKVMDSVKLKRLFSNHVRSCLTSVSLQNSNLGTIALRSRTITAGNIQDTVSAFDDHAQICNNVTGYSFEKNITTEKDERLRRYLGFNRGRISEYSARCNLRGYESWLKNIQTTLEAPRRPHPTFLRYAQRIASEIPPGASTPKHVLLDLTEVQNTYETLDFNGVSKGEPLIIEDSSCEVISGRYFEIKANGKNCIVQIHFDEGRQFYHLRSAELEKLYCRKSDQADKRDLITYLNQEQAFRVIPDAENLIYTLGEFYIPVFKVGKAFDPHTFSVSQILMPVPILETIGEEKGLPISPQEWPANTLFGIIDRLGRPPAGSNPVDYEVQDNSGRPASLQDYFGSPDILVCDDMGTESADFILTDRINRRVIFIHAKAKSNLHPVSASALQDVVAQATKNINFLGMYNLSAPKHLKLWEESWLCGKTAKIDRRIRLSPVGNNGEAVWKEIRSILRHPLADREVWLFLGKTLSKSRFELKLGQQIPDANALQAAYLLSATLTNVASVGAKLRIFCYP